MALPLEEKMKYEQGDGGTAPGYEASLELRCWEIDVIFNCFTASKR